MLVVATGSLLLFSSETKKTYNHCQVPCGIFDDPAIVSEINQACTTIRKAIVQSKSLHGKLGSDPLALNQMVRWINTKEEHCSKIITLIAEYCLCQRIKRPEFKTETDYLQALKIHHDVMQAAMKAKQSMDEAACDALEHAVDDLAKMYTK
jgi:small subunit ribosomal protein S27Ae